jgi:hypothetical protein
MSTLYAQSILSYSTVLSRACYASMADLSEAPDVAVLCLRGFSGNLSQRRSATLIAAYKNRARLTRIPDAIQLIFGGSPGSGSARAEM